MFQTLKLFMAYSWFPHVHTPTCIELGNDLKIITNQLICCLRALKND